MLHSLFFLLLGFIAGLFYSKGKVNPPLQAWLATKQGFYWLVARLRQLWQGRSAKSPKNNDVIDV